MFQAGVSGPAGSANVDTQGRLSSPTNNFGNDAALFIGVTNAANNAFRTFMAFQLAGIPAGAVVTDCRLTLNIIQRTNPTAGHVRRLCGEHWLDGDGQSEAQASWTNWRTGTAWGTAGAGTGTSGACTATIDYTTVGEVPYTPPAGTGLFTFPTLTALCQDALTARGGWLRLRISQDSEAAQSNLLKFDSSEAGTATNRPKLVVTWSSGAASSTSTSTSTTSTSTSTTSTSTTSISATTTSTSTTSTSTSTSSTTTSTVPPPVTMETRVTGSANDAEEASSGAVNLTSTDLELTQEATVQTVGMRFTGVAVPRGATILRAWVQFQVDEVSTASTTLAIAGQAVDQAPAFTTASRDISLRARTAAVSWSAVSMWPTVGAAGSAQRTPDLAAVVQPIVNRPGWASGNALALIITGTGKRVAVAYDGIPAGAPLLHVEHAPPTIP